MNTDLMFSSSATEWETPQEFFDTINKLYDFELDVCSTKQNAKCKRFYSPADDALSLPWKGVCWMNPPFGTEIGNWLKKAFTESRKAGTIVVALLPARTDTRWFHDYIYHKPGVTIDFIKGRLKFGDSKTSAPFPSMLVEFMKDEIKRPGRWLSGFFFYLEQRKEFYVTAEYGNSHLPAV